MELTAVLTPAEEGRYVALNPEAGTTIQGGTVEEAIASLTEATALYLSKFPLVPPGIRWSPCSAFPNMPKLPHVSGAAVVKALEQLRVAKVRQSGNHSSAAWLKRLRRSNAQRNQALEPLQAFCARQTYHKTNSSRRCDLDV
jgi:hypothetical protein